MSTQSGCGISVFGMFQTCATAHSGHPQGGYGSGVQWQRKNSAESQYMVMWVAASILTCPMELVITSKLVGLSRKGKAW